VTELNAGRVALTTVASCTSNGIRARRDVWPAPSPQPSPQRGEGDKLSFLSNFEGLHSFFPFTRSGEGKSRQGAIANPGVIGKLSPSPRRGEGRGEGSRRTGTCAVRGSSDPAHGLTAGLPASWRDLGTEGSPEFVAYDRGVRLRSSNPAGSRARAERAGAPSRSETRAERASFDVALLVVLAPKGPDKIAQGNALWTRKTAENEGKSPEGARHPAAMCRPSGLCRRFGNRHPGRCPGLLCGGPFGANEFSATPKRASPGGVRDPRRTRRGRGAAALI
jgi:hypothetical protein